MFQEILQGGSNESNDIVEIIGTVPNASTATSIFSFINMPEGFTYENCILLSYYIEYDGKSWNTTTNIATNTIPDNTIRIYNNNSTFAGKTIHVFLKKIK